MINKAFIIALILQYILLTVMVYEEIQIDHNNLFNNYLFYLGLFPIQLLLMIKVNIERLWRILVIIEPFIWLLALILTHGYKTSWEFTL